MINDFVGTFINKFQPTCENYLLDFNDQILYISKLFLG